MSEARDWADWNQLRKRCPNCGAAAQTLGTVCPNCGKPFVPRTLMDRMPLGSDWPMIGRLVMVLIAWMAVGFVWLAIKNFVAAAVLVGVVFGLLVGFVALNNWLLERASR